MRFIFLAYICLLCVSCISGRKPPITSVTIEEIKPRYIEADEFMRISEYLTGKEHQGDRVIIRSDPTDRSGYYFTLILDTDVRRMPAGTQVIGEFHTPKSLDAEVHNFELPARRPESNEIFVGLTGKDWPNKDALPGAWRFTIVDPNGLQLALKQSYLWSLE